MSEPVEVTIDLPGALPNSPSGADVGGRGMVEAFRDSILASRDTRFAPDPEHYDRLYARFRPVVGNADAAALAWLVATMSCAPVVPNYEAARAVERLFARVAGE